MGRSWRRVPILTVREESHKSAKVSCPDLDLHTQLFADVELLVIAIVIVVVAGIVAIVVVNVNCFAFVLAARVFIPGIGI